MLFRGLKSPVGVTEFIEGDLGVKLTHLIVLFAFILILAGCEKQPVRTRIDFTDNWKFQLGDDSLAFGKGYDDNSWRSLNLPHDWSIEGTFSEENPTGSDGGYLPAGIGWYRKSFKLPKARKQQQSYIDFDGVYRNSEVWINGHYLGKRPYGYSSFRYDLTPFLLYGDSANVLAVRVDNSAQPNSRWYTGSGIYRNVWLVRTGKVHVDHWGIFVTTSNIQHHEASVNVEVKVKNTASIKQQVKVKVFILDTRGYIEEEEERVVEIEKEPYTDNFHFLIPYPQLWSFDTPNLYQAKVEIYDENEMIDEYQTPFGFREFHFDAEKGFFLNGEHVKLHGVNNHHDLGALGAAFNVRAAERQLEILKKMGCNAIRMSHNPPAPELLDLCDRMGFFVMDEAFDMWAKKKMKHDYHDDWAEWHTRDLQDMVLRDRNHPSVMVWSIGNEIREQFDSTGITIGKELVETVKALDTTRTVTSALTETVPEKNFIYQSNALDILSFNYKHYDYPDLPNRFPGVPFIAAENMSAFATRGCYDMPSDSVRIWPSAYKAPLVGSNDDLTCSSYDNVHAYWGATHQDSWAMVKKLDFIAGMFIWSGFDYLGEPTPYPWPARSSYFGVIDLSGFPKDIYYFYQSEWSDSTVLHLFPHWNWKEGQTVDVWAYYNNADEVELFLNGKSIGIRKKEGGLMHVMWRVKFASGTLKAVSRKNGEIVKEQIIRTAGEPAKIELTADRSVIKANGKDLSFITVRVIDKEGNMVPDANDLIHFKIEGAGFIAGVDNGYQASLEPFKANSRKAYNGMCLAIIQSEGIKGKIKLEAIAEGLESSNIELVVK